MSATTDSKKLDVADALRKLNHYQRLGLKTNAVTLEEIENAFRSRLALFHSVDAHMSVQEIDEADRLIQESLAVLQNSQLRRRYDRTLYKQQARLQRQAKADQLVETSDHTPSTDKPSTDKPSTDNADWSARYQLGKKISESERSEIFRALDTRLNRQVIVKRLRAELVGSQSHDQLFREQAALYAGCNSGKLVTILDYDIQSSSIVLELLSQDLSSSTAQYAGNFESVRDVLRDVLQGLAFLHSRGIAHGRIELPHLLLDNMGGVKLSITPGMTGTATALRPSPQAVHVAPEMLNSIVFGQPDLAIDVYALGFIALELLCGKRLAQKVSPTISPERLDAKNWLLWHSSPAEHLPAIASIVRGIPGDLAELLQRMTSKQQDERFRNAKECLEFMTQQRSESLPVASSRSAVIEVDEGVEIFGSPPTLHQTYQAESTSTWSEVVLAPKLLLKPRGRKQLNYLAIGGLIVASLAMLLHEPTSIEPNEPLADLNGQVVNDESLQAMPETDLSDSQASANGQTEEPPTLPAIEDQEIQAADVGSSLDTFDLALETSVDEAELLPAPGQDDSVDVGEEPQDVAALTKTAGVEIVSSTPMVDHKDEIDSYADVRGKTYQPIPQPFEYCGEADPSAARMQIQAVRSLLERLQSGIRTGDSADKPFVVPQRAVDPRVSFAMALWAHRHGSKRLAMEYCRKSIRDAMAFDVPFVLPLQLLNHLHMEVGEFAPALAECRSVCQWVTKERVHAQPFELAGEEVAWWMGTVVGFLENGKQSRYRSDTDIPHTVELLERLCKVSQVEKFRIAQLRVLRLHTDATTEWDRQQANRDTFVEVEDDSFNGSSLVRNWFEQRYFGAPRANQMALANPHGYDSVAESPAIPLGGSLSGISLSGGSLADVKPEPKAESKPRMKRVRHPVTAPSPHRFSTYHACDVTALASQTLATLSDCAQAEQLPGSSASGAATATLVLQKNQGKR